jgi:hypothetical protein
MLIETEISGRAVISRCLRHASEGNTLREGNAWWWVGTGGAENLVDVRKN